MQVIMILTVAAVMFTGCKNSSENETISETVKTELVQTNDTNEAIDLEVASTGNFVEDEDASAQFSKIATSIGVPLLSVKTTVRKHYWGGKVLNIRYDEISISGDGFEAAAQAVSEWNKQDIEQIEKWDNYTGYTNEFTSDADKLPTGYADDVAYDFTSGVMDDKKQWYLDAYWIVYSYTNIEDTVWHGNILNNHEDASETDDDYTTYLYDITDGGITKNEELEYTWIIKPVNTNSLILLDIINAFGTYFGYAACIIDESSGKIVYPKLHYTNAEFSNTTLTLIRELPVVIYDEESTLPPGTPLQITAVSDSGTAYFYELNDGLEGLSFCRTVVKRRG